MENIPNIPRRTRGDRITAEDHNNLAKAISNISRRIPPGGKDYRPIFNEYHPFEFYNVRKSGGAWDVRIEPGFVIETNIQLSTVTKTWTPEIAATPMTDATLAVPIRITIADGDEIYLTFETNQKGLISAAPEIEVTTSAGAVHHVPPSPGNSGTNGVYKIKIATCTITNSVMFIEDVELRDNFYWPNQLIELENVGSEAEIVKAFDATNNKHPHRTLKGDGTDPGSGSDIHDLYLTATQNADTIAFSGKVEITGSGTSSSPPWKATPNGDEFINVARGHVMGFKPYTDGTYGSADFFLPFVEILQTYAGGTVEVTDATGFLYATCTVTSSIEGQEGAYGDGDIGGDLYRPAAAPTVVFSDVAIAAYSPLDAKVHFLLAEVSKAGGVAAVEEQLLFHNPSIQLDSVFNIPS